MMNNLIGMEAYRDYNKYRQFQPGVSSQLSKTLYVA